jgi:hypothetical protein
VAQELHDVIRRTGRSVAIVGNDASQAVDTYLRDHDLTRYIDGVAGRLVRRRSRARSSRTASTFAITGVPGLK